MDFCGFIRKEFFGEKETKSAYATTIKSETFFWACSLALSMTPLGADALTVLPLTFIVVFFFAMSEHGSTHSRPSNIPPPTIPSLIHFPPTRRRQGWGLWMKNEKNTGHSKDKQLSPLSFSLSLSLCLCLDYRVEPCLHGSTRLRLIKPWSRSCLIKSWRLFLFSCSRWDTARTNEVS